MIAEIDFPELFKPLIVTTASGLGEFGQDRRIYLVHTSLSVYVSMYLGYYVIP